MSQKAIECALVRGGTSKGVFIPEDNVPEDWDDDSILSLFGSPDPRQIDGLGGGTSTSSKLMIIGPCDQENVDAQFTFGQVSVDKPVIDYGGTCGNLTFGIGPFAIDEGIVDVDDNCEQTTLTLYNTNTESYVEQTIPIKDGDTQKEGDFEVAGVPRTYPRIDSKFLEPAGTETGELFPLGGPTIELDTADGTYEVSVVDVINPVVYVRPADLGLEGDELPVDIDTNKELLKKLERLRGMACEALGYVDDSSKSAEVSPGVPKLAFVSEPTSYTTTDDQQIQQNEIEITARIMSMQKLHPVYAVSGAACTAVASMLPHTIPHRVSEGCANHAEITLGHPMGTLSVKADVDSKTNTVHSVTIPRTQRRLIEGSAYY